MAIEVKAPDGSIARFPDGMPDAEIEAVMRKTFGGPASSDMGLSPSEENAAVTGGGEQYGPGENWYDKIGRKIDETPGDSPGKFVAETVHKLGDMLIRQPVRAAERIMQMPVVHPDEMTNRQAAEMLGAGVEAAGLGLTGNVPRATREGAAAISEIAALGPRTDLPPVATPEARMPAMKPKDELAAASERLGLEIPRAAATDSLVAKQMSGALSVVPGVGSPIVKSAQKATADLDARVQGLVNDLGGATPQEAGQAVKHDAVGWMKDGSKREGTEIYRDVEALMVGAEGPLTKTKEAVNDIVQVAAESRLPPPQIVRIISDAVNDPNGLSYEGLQNLRTQVGDMLSGKIAPEPGMSARALRHIYGSLSDDLRDMARSAGANAVSKRNAKKGGARGVEIWDEANARFQTEIVEKREALSRLVGLQADAAPEAVVATLARMAGSKGGADAGRLQQALAVMTPETRRDLGAAVIAQLGRDKDGFSPAKFRTAYEGNLSPVGKQLLFPDKAHRQALDDIATVSKSFEQLQRLGNPSGTGRVAGLLTAAGGAVSAPLTTIGLAVGGYTLSRLLAKPVTARKVADFSKAYLDATSNRTSKTLQAYQLAAHNLAEAIDSEGEE